MSNWRENILGVCCINQYPQTKPKLVGLNFKRSKIIEDYVHIRAKGVSHTTSIHNHWTISYHYKSSLRVCSIESMIVIRSFKMAHLRKNKSTFSLQNVKAPSWYRKLWSYPLQWIALAHEILTANVKMKDNGL